MFSRKWWDESDAVKLCSVVIEDDDEVSCEQTCAINCAALSHRKAGFYVVPSFDPALAI